MKKSWQFISYIINYLSAIYNLAEETSNCTSMAAENK